MEFELALPVKPLTSGKVYSAKEFLSHFHGTLFLKVLKSDYNHHGFEYKPGTVNVPVLNVDTVPFKGSGSCSAGGLYFTELFKLYHWLFTYGTEVHLVKIPENENVYVENNKFKVQSFELCGQLNPDWIKERRLMGTNMKLLKPD